MRTAREMLRNRPFIFDSIHPGTLVIDALTMLNSRNQSYVVVMDEGSYKGIFCEKDYTRNVILRGKSSRDTHVGEVMTVDLPVVTASDSISHCAEQLILHKCRYLLVFDNDQFIGVITMQDLLREALRSRLLTQASVY